MIQLKNISKIYNTNNNSITALQNINFIINTGEIFGVIGKSGAGKSTLIRCINLLEQPTEGNVFINGQDLTILSAKKLRQARRQIGMIFQHFNLLANRTVYENITLPLELEKKSKAEIETIVNPLLELTSLTDKKKVYPAQLSGGQKQRVAIARALACQPNVLLCDEATSALDPQTTKTILQLLKDINQKLGLTILLITHEVDVIKEICDRVAMIDNGKIIEEDDIITFFTQPQTALAKEFVKSALKQELPASLQQQIILEKMPNTNSLLRIIFHGKAAAEPLISHLMQTLNIKLNILQANIEYLKENRLGIMVVEAVDVTDQDLSSAINYLQQKNVNAEIIGYVKQHVI